MTYLVVKQKTEKDVELAALQLQQNSLGLVEKFMPHLLGNEEKSKEFALYALATLGSARVALDFAERDPSSGAVAAIVAMALDSRDEQLSEMARISLARMYTHHNKSVFHIELGGIGAKGYILAGGRYGVIPGVRFDDSLCGQEVPVRTRDGRSHRATVDCGCDQPAVFVRFNRSLHSHFSSAYSDFSSLADPVVGIEGQFDNSDTPIVTLGYVVSLDGDRMSIAFTENLGVPSVVVDLSGNLIGVWFSEAGGAKPDYLRFDIVRDQCGKLTSTSEIR